MWNTPVSTVEEDPPLRQFVEYGCYNCLLPMNGGKVNGTVLAFCQDTGVIQWTCEYTDGVANGEYNQFFNGEYSFSKSFDYLSDLRLIAMKCAEYVLADEENLS